MQLIATSMPVAPRQGTTYQQRLVTTCIVTCQYWRGGAAVIQVKCTNCAAQVLPFPLLSTVWAALCICTFYSCTVTFAFVSVYFYLYLFHLYLYLYLFHLYLWSHSSIPLSLNWLCRWSFSYFRSKMPEVEGVNLEQTRWKIQCGKCKNYNVWNVRNTIRKM